LDPDLGTHLTKNNYHGLYNNNNNNNNHYFHLPMFSSLLLPPLH
jgi:hypothetical protein